MDSRSQDSTMGETSITNKRSTATIFLAHLGGFLFLILAASWLRRITLHPDPLLQGYLQVISGLLAFVFAAVTLVRFQGTQDRISLILGAGFLLSGAILTATSVLFFQFLPDAPLRLLWAPIAWWLGRIVLALLLVVALLVEHFLPRSRHPRREIAGALLAVVALTYVLAVALRRLPPEVSRHPGACFPNPEQLLPGAIFLVSLVWFRRRLSVEDSAFDRTIYAATWLNVAAQLSSAEEEAHRVADRIREVMANDDEPPRLSASIGISVYRCDGERIETLLSEADKHLYAEKTKRAKRNAAAANPRRRTPKT